MERLKEDKQVFVDGCGKRIFKFIGIDVSNGKTILKDGDSIRSEDVKHIIPVYPAYGDYCQLYVKLQDAVKKTKNLRYSQVLRLLSEIAVKYDLSEVKMASLITHVIGYINKCKTTNIIDLEKFRNNCDAFAYLQSDLNESNIRPILAEDSGKTTLMEAAVSMVPSREEIFGVKNEDCAVIDGNSLNVREAKAEVALHELLTSYSIEDVKIPEMKCVYSKTFNFDKEQEVLFLERIVDRLQNSNRDDNMDAIRLSYVMLLSAGDIIEWYARQEIDNLNMSKLKIQEKPVCLEGVEQKYSINMFRGKYKVGDFIYEVSPDNEFTKKYVVTSVAADRIDAVEVVKGVTYRFSPDDEFTRFSK